MSSYDPKQVARAVRQHRTAAGWTQAELAERASLADETISRIESGREPPSLRTAANLADALDVPLDVVVGRTPARPVRREARPSREVRRLAAVAESLDVGTLRHLLAIVRALGAGGRAARPRVAGRHRAR